MINTIIDLEEIIKRSIEEYNLIKKNDKITGANINHTFKIDIKQIDFPTKSVIISYDDNDLGNINKANFTTLLDTLTLNKLISYILTDINNHIDKSAIHIDNDNELKNIPIKTELNKDDIILIEDSEDEYNKKKVNLDILKDNINNQLIGLKYYTIYANCSPGGYIFPSGNIFINRGGEQSFKIVPYDNYEIENVLIDGISHGPIKYYKFSNVNKDHTIIARFRRKKYVIEVKHSENGIVNPDGIVEVEYGEDQSFEFIPLYGYEIEDVLVDSISIGSIDRYTFTNVNSNHVLTVNFRKKIFTVTTIVEGPGKIVPSNIQARYGENIKLKIIPNPGSHLSYIKINDNILGPIEEYEIHSISKDYTILAVFDVNTYTINITLIPDNAGEVDNKTLIVREHDNAIINIYPNIGYMAYQAFYYDNDEIHYLEINNNQLIIEDVTKNYNVTIKLVPVNFTIDLIENPDEYGEIIGPTNGIFGESITYSIVPFEGYELKRLIINNKDVTPTNTYTISFLDKDYTIEAIFGYQTEVTYSLQIKTTNYGKIKVNNSIEVGPNETKTLTFKKGSTINIKLIPDNDCSIKQLKIDNTDYGTLSEYTFDYLYKNHIIFAEFVKTEDIPKAYSYLYIVGSYMRESNYCFTNIECLDSDVTLIDMVNNRRGSRVFYSTKIHTFDAWKVFGIIKVEYPQNKKTFKIITRTSYGLVSPTYIYLNSIEFCKTDIETNQIGFKFKPYSSWGNTNCTYYGPPQVYIHSKDLRYNCDLSDPSDYYEIDPRKTCWGNGSYEITFETGINMVYKVPQFKLSYHYRSKFIDHRSELHEPPNAYQKFTIKLKGQAKVIFKYIGTSNNIEYETLENKTYQEKEIIITAKTGTYIEVLDIYTYNNYRLSKFISSNDILRLDYEQPTKTHYIIIEPKIIVTQDSTKNNLTIELVRLDYISQYGYAIGGTRYGLSKEITYLYRNNELIDPFSSIYDYKVYSKGEEIQEEFSKLLFKGLDTDNKFYIFGVTSVLYNNLKNISEIANDTKFSLISPGQVITLDPATNRISRPSVAHYNSAFYYFYGVLPIRRYYRFDGNIYTPCYLCDSSYVVKYSNDTKSLLYINSDYTLRTCGGLDSSSIFLFGGQKRFTIQIADNEYKIDRSTIEYIDNNNNTKTFTSSIMIVSSISKYNIDTNTYTDNFSDLTYHEWYCTTASIKDYIYISTENGLFTFSTKTNELSSSKQVPMLYGLSTNTKNKIIGIKTDLNFDYIDSINIDNNLELRKYNLKIDNSYYYIYSIQAQSNSLLFQNDFDKNIFLASSTSGENDIIAFTGGCNPNRMITIANSSITYINLNSMGTAKEIGSINSSVYHVGGSDLT